MYNRAYSVLYVPGLKHKVYDDKGNTHIIYLPYHPTTTIKKYIQQHF